MENRGILFDKDGTCIRFDTLWQAGLQACFETLSMLAPHHSAEIKKILAIQEQRFLQNIYLMKSFIRNFIRNWRNLRN